MTADLAPRPVLEPWTRPAAPGEVLHLSGHGPLGHAPFRLTAGGTRHVIVRPSHARVPRWEGMRLPDALVVPEDEPSVILIRTDTSEHAQGHVGAFDAPASHAGWAVLWGTTGGLPISEDGDVRDHGDAHGFAEPTAFDGQVLSYTNNLFREGRKMPLADLDPVPRRPLAEGDRAA